MIHFTAMFGYMESVEHEFLRSLGMSVKMDDADGTVSWPRVAAQCDYQGPVGFEDLLDIELSIERLGAKSVTYQFNIQCQGKPTAQGKMTAVCCRIEHDVAPKSIPIPSWLVEQLRTFETPAS